jgi:hypothetical protein
MGKQVVFKVIVLCDNFVINVQNFEKCLDKDSLKDDYLDIIQSVIDKYENNGVTIDTSGEENDNFLIEEFEFPDVCTKKELNSVMKTAIKFLDDLFSSFSKAGYTTN